MSAALLLLCLPLPLCLANLAVIAQLPVQGVYLLLAVVLLLLLAVLLVTSRVLVHIRRQPQDTPEMPTDVPPPAEALPMVPAQEATLTLVQPETVQ